jgi:hypothetical protein
MSIFYLMWSLNILQCDGYTVSAEAVSYFVVYSYVDSTNSLVEIILVLGIPFLSFHSISISSIEVLV